MIRNYKDRTINSLSLEGYLYWYQLDRTLAHNKHGVTRQDHPILPLKIFISKIIFDK